MTTHEINKSSKVTLHVEKGEEGLWYVTSPEPRGLLIAGDTMHNALLQVQKALDDMATVSEPDPAWMVEVAREVKPFHSADPGGVSMGEILRHVRTGGLYEVLHRGATVRTSVPLTDYATVMVIAYNKRNPVSVSVRPAHWIVAGHDVLFDSAQIQTSKPLQSGAEVVVYRAINGGPVWVRPTSEMDDGRFEPAQAIEARQGGDAEGSSVEDKSAVAAGDVPASKLQDQPPSSTPGEVERLIRQHVLRDLTSPESISAGIAAATAAILSHISTAGRGEGGESRDVGRALKDALFACLKEGGADRQYGGVLTEGGKYAWIRFTREAPAADATNPQDQE